MSLTPAEFAEAHRGRIRFPVHMDAGTRRALGELWSAIWRWLVFTVIGGFLPFVCLFYPWMTQKNVGMPTWADFCGHGEILAVAVVLIVASIGDALGGLRRGHGRWAKATIVVGILLAIVGAGFFSWVRVMPESHDVDKLSNSSGVFLLISFALGLAGKVLDEVGK